ncbi:hypothetical protein LZ32DRAFT_231185 [Colletotrichum eremochloae]|nr:hypothetical protein LZ32DRAFT_231185 [Colletotrichum eremochloae]
MAVGGMKLQSSTYNEGGRGEGSTKVLIQGGRGQYRYQCSKWEKWRGIGGQRSGPAEIPGDLGNDVVGTSDDVGVRLGILMATDLEDVGMLPPKKVGTSLWYLSGRDARLVSGAGSLPRLLRKSGWGRRQRPRESVAKALEWNSVLDHNLLFFRLCSPFRVSLALSSKGRNSESQGIDFGDKLTGLSWKGYLALLLLSKFASEGREKWGLWHGRV